MPSMPAAKFFYERHRFVMHHYLPHYQYVLHLDADSLVLNLSRPLEPYFLHRKEHIFLHMHENGEVTAAAYLLRNSRVSRCFLQFWADFSPPHTIDATLGLIPHASNADVTRPGLPEFPEMTYEVGNYDNGDLVVAMTSLLGPKIYKSCLRNISFRSARYFQQLSNPYHETAVECWKATHPSLPHRVASLAPFIRIFLPREGFWRTHAKRGRFDKWWDDLFGSCYGSSDVIGHGWKAMAREMWKIPNTDNDKNNNNNNNEDQKCNLEAISAGKGANNQCLWLSRTEELKIATDYCMFKSPVCLEQHSCGQVNVTRLDPGSREDMNTDRRGKRKKNIKGGVMTAECNACIRDGSGCVAAKRIRRAGVGTRAQFGVGNEAWWREQMCAACQ